MGVFVSETSFFRAPKWLIFASKAAMVGIGRPMSSLMRSYAKKI